jgi:predicted phage tail protein
MSVASSVLLARPRLVIVSAMALFGMVGSAAAQSVPAAPQNLTQSVSGTTVTLTWNPPLGGGATGYIVEASVVPGGALVASLPVAATSLVVPNVPAGVYYVRVRAVNGAGSSAPSNEVTVSVTGSTGCPAPPLTPQLIVRATGLNVSVNWSSPGGCPPSSYTLLAGSAPGLANIAQVNMGGQTGLSAVAPPGTYFIRVVASNAFGSATSQELTARVAVNAVTETVQPFSALLYDLTLITSGAYVGTLVWDDPGIDLDFYLTSPGCPFPPTACTLVISDSPAGTSEQVVWPVRAGESYRFWIDNLSDRATSFTIISTVTVGDRR